MTRRGNGSESTIAPDIGHGLFSIAQMTVGVSLSPDQRHLLFPQRESSGSDLMLVENFPEGPGTALAEGLSHLSLIDQDRTLPKRARLIVPLS